MEKQETGAYTEDRTLPVGRLVKWLAHVLIIYGIGAGFLCVFIKSISAVDWWEWLTVPIAFLLSNIFE